MVGVASNSERIQVSNSCYRAKNVRTAFEVAVTPTAMKPNQVANSHEHPTSRVFSDSYAIGVYDFPDLGSAIPH